MWFKPKCPITVDQKEWLEDSMLWLSKELRTDSFCSRPTITPTDEHFPFTYSATRDGANQMLRLVAKYMGIPGKSVNLRLYTEGDPELDATLPEISRSRAGSAGHFNLKKQDGKYQIAIERSGLRDPFGLVATLSHELGHVILLGGKLVKPTAEDHEFLTDLLTVYYGFGIFTANNAFEFRQSSSGWSAARTGYLTQSMFGYALALYARMKGETNPNWLSHLDKDIRNSYKQSIKYIEYFDDCRISRICQGTI